MPSLAAVRLRGGTILALPKGHIEPGEAFVEAARREVREETGLDAAPIGKLDEVRYWYTRDGRRVSKEVVFFLFRFLSGSLEDHDDEVESVEWVALADAPAALSYRGERRVAELAAARAEEALGAVE